MLTRKAKYALRASLHLAEWYERGPRLIQQISDAEEIPKKFLELILLELKNVGLLESKKGKGGGYSLAKPPEEITVGAIVRTIDGPLAPTRCSSVTSPMPCDDCPDPNLCGLKSVMREARDAIAEVFDNISLAEVARRTDLLRSENNDAPMYFI